eukprot:jgi/Tetstr1/454621/TSEL_041513.t1
MRHSQFAGVGVGVGVGVGAMAAVGPGAEVNVSDGVGFPSDPSTYEAFGSHKLVQRTLHFLSSSLTA